MCQGELLEDSLAFGINAHLLGRASVPTFEAIKILHLQHFFSDDNKITIAV